jgi:Ca-activated chloride channel family protein
MQDIGAPVVVAAFWVAALPLLQQPPTFRATADVVEVYTTVTDGRGLPVTGLGPGDFELFVDGRRRPVTVFAAPPQRLSMTMLLDRTGSTARMSTEIADAASAFVDLLGPHDRVALSSLTWDCLDPTTDHQLLKQTVRSGMPADVASALWEAIDRVSFALLRETGRKAILVLSDGQNSNVPLVRQEDAYRAGVDDSPCHPPTFETGALADEVARRADRNGIMIYAVSVEGENGTSDSQLRTLARQTGGDVLRMQDRERLETVFTRVAAEIRTQYLLGFEPVTRDDKAHRIEVRVRRPGLRVRARQSYILDGMVRLPTETRRDKAPAVSEEEISRALERGRSGEVLEAACRVYIPEINSRYAVRAEGPLGRIMREARNARKAGGRLSRADLTSYHLAAAVHVTAEGLSAEALVPPEPYDDSNRRPSQPRVTRAVFPTRIKVRGVSDVPRILGRVDPRSVGYLTLPDETVLDQAEFQALADPVEVIVIAGPSEGRCRFPVGAVSRVR